MIFRQDEDLAPLQEGVDTTRLWVSDQQWLAILERVQRGQPLDLDGDRDSRRLHPREACSMRCLLRLGGTCGTFIVRTKDISAGGLRFVHGQPLRPSTRCTIALQPQHGMGRILGAVVAWCKEVEFADPDLEGYDIGVNFDAPVDTRAFTGAA